MSEFKELYRNCYYYMEDGQYDSFENMDWDEIGIVSKKEIASNDSPQGHYLLSLHYMMNGEGEKRMEELLKAANLGSCIAAIEYSDKAGYQGVEILGIAKAMNELGHRLASLQEDIDDIMEGIEPGSKEMIQIEEKSIEVKKNISDRNLNVYW